MADHPGAAPVATDQGFSKTLRWWDGVVINLALPAALFVSLGASIGAIGVWTAVALWALTAALATMHNWACTTPGWPTTGWPGRKAGTSPSPCTRR